MLSAIAFNSNESFYFIRIILKFIFYARRLLEESIVQIFPFGSY